MVWKPREQRRPGHEAITRRRSGPRYVIDSYGVYVHHVVAPLHSMLAPLRSSYKRHVSSHDVASAHKSLLPLRRVPHRTFASPEKKKKKKSESVFLRGYVTSTTSLAQEWKQKRTITALHHDVLAKVGTESAPVAGESGAWGRLSAGWVAAGRSLASRGDRDPWTARMFSPST